MAFKLSFGANQPSRDLSSASVSFTPRSPSLFDDALPSTAFGRSSVGTMALMGPRASKSNAIRIRQSGFEDFRRVGKRENDPRYYRFSLRRSGRVEISIQNRAFGGLVGFSTSPLKVRLERSNGKVLNRRTIGGGGLSFIIRRLDRNTTYYIRVSSSGKSVPYRLGFRTRDGAELFR